MKKAIAILLIAAVAAICTENSYRFLILGDRTGGPRPGIMTAIVNKCLEINPAPEFFLDVGDHIAGYTSDSSEIAKQWAEAKTFYKPLADKMKWYAVAGNHDISYPSMIESWKREMGEPDYSFEYKGDYYIVLNNALWSSADNMEKVQFDWLKKELVAAKNRRHVFVFYHIPMWKESPNEKSMDKLHNLFKDDVDYVICGHYHALLYGKRGRVQYITLGSSGGAASNRKADGTSYQYMIVDVKEGAIKPVVLTMTGDTLPLTETATKEWTAIEEFETKGFVFQSKPYDVNVKGKNISLSLEVNNKTSSSKKCFLQWEYAKAGDWKIMPETLTIEAKPNKKQEVQFKATASLLNNLPKLKAQFIVEGDTFSAGALPRFERGFPVAKVEKSAVVNIDGTLDEKVWKTFIQDQRNSFGNGTDASDSTCFTLAYDKENLYIAFKAYDSDSAGMVIQTKEGVRDAVTMAEESIRLYHSLNSSSEKFWQINVAAGNAITDMLVERSAEMFTNRPEWSGVDAFKVIRNSTGWQGEIKIPWKALGAQGAESLRMNVRRDKDSKGRRTFYQEPFLRDPQTFPLFELGK
ncbi:MAG: metallophosphoesterase [Fibrobacteres bacterium]|nr:metallophosphoesterase [Fibrobacterota bacterium]